MIRKSRLYCSVVSHPQGIVSRFEGKSTILMECTSLVQFPCCLSLVPSSIPRSPTASSSLSPHFVSSDASPAVVIDASTFQTWLSITEEDAPTHVFRGLFFSFFPLFRPILLEVTLLIEAITYFNWRRCKCASIQLRIE